MIDTWIIVPAYNEADRLDTEAFHAYSLTHKNVGFLFVDDGSTDKTATILSELCGLNPDAIASIRLDVNAGKAEAVRCGMLHCLEGQPLYVGYWDADLATPLEAISSFTELLKKRPEIHLVMGARVQLLGRQIQRNPIRHYLGRVFATVVSEMLDLHVYDTQCGAKLFRRTTWLRGIFERPFLASWIFDVEILARMMQVKQSGGIQKMETCIYEYPLTKWVDVHGSKVGPRAYALAARDLLRIYRRYLAAERKWRPRRRLMETDRTRAVRSTNKDLKNGSENRSAKTSDRTGTRFRSIDLKL